MSYIGKLEAFDSARESWSQYVERYEIFITANKVIDPDEQKLALLTVMGMDTYNRLRDLARPDTPLSLDKDAILALLSNHFQPKPNVITERFFFNACVRQERESVALFVARLKRLAEHCDYGTMLNDLIRDRFVCGIKNDEIQARLLAEDKLTLDSAIKLATQIELATQNVKELKHQSLIQDSSAISTTGLQHIQSQPRIPTAGFSKHYNTPQPLPPSCTRCGASSHSDFNCVHQHTVCRRCNRRGHLARVCTASTIPLRMHSTGYQQFRNSRFQTGQRYSANGRRFSANQINYELDPLADQLAALDTTRQFYHQHEQSDNPHDYPVHHVNVLHTTAAFRNTAPCYVTCQINGLEARLEIDTGSAFTLLSEATMARLGVTQPLEPFEGSLTSFSGHGISVLGLCHVKVAYEGCEEILPALVFQGYGADLCGRNWLRSRLKILNLPFAVPDLRVSPISSVKVASACPSDLMTLLDKHSALFSPGTGCLKGRKVKLHIRADARPQFFKARSVPYALKDAVDSELNRLQQEGIITSIPYADYAAPIVPVQKPNGKIRICGDFKLTVNKAIDTERYPLPKADDIFASLAGCTIFTRLDLRDAYNQLQLDDESQSIVVINTHKGLFRFNRLPFGVTSASAIFQRQMEVLLQNQPGVAPFQGDVLLGGSTLSQHLTRLDEVLTIFENAGLKLRKEKCAFAKDCVDFLGHTLDAHGLHPQKSKMQAIEEAPSPKNVEELRSFIGLLNYYHKFLPNNSTMLAPLYDLTKKSVPWHWTVQHDQAFIHAKHSIKNSNLLAHYDPKKELFLACDASPVGVGAVISHLINGVEVPIAFASSTLSAAERGYPQIEREALSIIFGLRRFRDYLLGRHFYIVTDHQPLIAIFSENRLVPQTAALCIRRWALQLSGYHYTIKYKKGSSHSNADALSRLPLPALATDADQQDDRVLLLRDSQDDRVIDVTAVKQATMSDPTLRDVLRYLQDGWPANKPVNLSLRSFFDRRPDLTIEEMIAITLC